MIAVDREVYRVLLEPLPPATLHRGKASKAELTANEHSRFCIFAVTRQNYNSIFFGKERLLLRGEVIYPFKYIRLNGHFICMSVFSLPYKWLEFSLSSKLLLSNCGLRTFCCFYFALAVVIYCFATAVAFKGSYNVSPGLLNIPPMTLIYDLFMGIVIGSDTQSAWSATKSEQTNCV